jgi:hypothetical protein
MKIDLNFKNLFLFAAILLIMVMVPSGAFAQKDAPTGPQWMEVTTVTVRPDKAGEFRDFFVKEFKPALMKGGLKEQWVWSTAGFGDEFVYYFVSPMEKFAELDGPSPMEKALGRDGMRPFFTRAGALVKSVHTAAMIERPDMTYMGKMTGQPKMAVMIGVNVAQGHEADFENFIINEYLPVFKKSDAKAFLAHQTVFGGSQGEYVMLSPIDNFAELDKGHPIARVLGQDGFKKLMQKLPAGTIAESEVNIIHFDPSMSIMPAAK